jgi:hypothetical protein
MNRLSIWKLSFLLVPLSVPVPRTGQLGQADRALEVGDLRGFDPARWQVVVDEHADRRHEAAGDRPGKHRRLAAPGHGRSGRQQSRTKGEADSGSACGAKKQAT